MFKKLFLFLALVPQIILAQDEPMPNSIDEVIRWEFSVTYEGDEAILHMTVFQKDHWHIYSQVQPEGSIAYPTEFTFEKNDNYDLVGKVKESGAKEFSGQFPEKYFPNEKAKFTQRIKIKTDKKFDIKVEYGFMACKTACFPPDFREHVFKIDGSKRTGSEESTEVEDPTTDEQIEETESGLDSTFLALSGTCEGFGYSDVFDPVKVRVSEAVRTDKKNYSISITIEIDSIFAMYAFDNATGYKSIFTLHDHANIESKDEYTTTIRKIIGEDSKGYKYNVGIQQNITIKDTLNTEPITGELDLYLMGCENSFHNKENVPLSFDLTKALDNGTRTEKDSLWIIFFLSFMGGLLALLTPCVFPMIPMTVSFFTKQSKTKAQGIRKATLYSTFIILIYVILGVLVSSIAGGDALNAMATNPWVNIVFFSLFVIFAISFFGAFEITLPASWVNKADKQADKGGLIGIFFMAFTLALVSFHVLDLLWDQY